MDVLSDYAKAELVIKNSRFLAEAIPIKTQEQARITIKSQKTRYVDASHVVHAFAVGNNAEILGMSDDGEPAGTAGRPVLDILKGRKCTNIIVTVTRWFGGTLLGTGGLVKAYGDSAKAVLDIARFHALTAQRTFNFAVSYDNYELAKRFLSSIEANNITEKFDTSVHFEGRIFSSVEKQLVCYVSELTKGSSTVFVGEEEYV